MTSVHLRSRDQASPVRVVKLIFQTYLPYQGRYPRVSGQAKILKDNGFDVTILACDRDGHHAQREELEGIRVQRIHVKSGENRGPLRQLWPLLVFSVRSLRWLMRQRFDIVHCHNIDVLPVGCLVQLLTRSAVLFDAHEPDYYAMWTKRRKPILRLLNVLERFLARRMDAVSVTNQFQVDKYRRIGVRRVQLVGNYPLPDLRIDTLPEEKFQRRQVVFGRLGTIYRDTGFESLVAAFQQILREYPDTNLLIAGRLADNYQRDFQHVIAPIRENVRLIGSFPARDMPQLYHQIDVSLLIYPRNDWFRNITPRKFFDSMANGVPVIITDIGRLGDVVNRHECGLVVSETDVESIVHAMRRMIENVPLRRRLARNSLRLAKSEFDWNRMADQYLSLQRELLGETCREQVVR